MDYNKASTLLENALKGFHGRFKKMYGQVAMRLDGSTYLTTGGNALLSAVTSDDFIVCDMNTGDLGEIFRKCPDINALIFGCSQDTVAVSDRDTDLPVSLEDLAHLTGQTLRVIPDTTPENIISVLGNSGVCLIKGTGALAAASNPRKAVAGIQIIEKACEAEIHGSMLGGAVAIPAEYAEDCREDFSGNYVKRNEESSVAFLGFDESEFALRSQLIEYGKELVRRDLAYGSWGNLSVRLNDHEMLITPSSMDYFDIKPEDIVRVDINTFEHGSQRMPSGFTIVHAALYRELPECGAIIHTHSNALSVFAACRAGFAITDPEMHNIIGDVKVSQPALPYTQELADNITETMKETHAAVIPHHGGIFTGPSLDVVFAVAEAVEMRARNLLSFD